MESQNQNGERRLPLEKLAVQNFACLKDTEVEFSPFTVLVGPNDSGKSMILRALEMLSLGCDGTQNAFRSQSEFRVATSDSNEKPIAVQIAGRVMDLDYSYGLAFASAGGKVHYDDDVLEIGKGAQPGMPFVRIARDNGTMTSVYRGDSTRYSWNGPAFPILSSSWFENGFQQARLLSHNSSIRPYLEMLLKVVKGNVPFRLDTKRLKQPVSVDHESHSGPFEQDGFGIAKTLATLLLERGELIPKIEAVLHSSLNNVSKVHARLSGSLFELEVELPSGAHVQSQYISDGVVLFLAYILLAMGPDRKSVLLLEEPEIGIHPGLLKLVVEFLRGLTVNASNPQPVQVIITTHSPVLLNYVEPHEIRVVQRTESEGTKVFPFESAPDLKRLLEYQGPGEIWVNMSEDYITSGKNGG